MSGLLRRRGNVFILLPKNKLVISYPSKHPSRYVGSASADYEHTLRRVFDKSRLTLWAICGLALPDRSSCERFFNQRVD